MFFQPTTVASMVAGEPATELYSDFHKDAIGCRPGAAQFHRYSKMSPIELAVEHKRLGEWMAEDERIDAMAHEVARFRFSRCMEYCYRRGDAGTRLGAFTQAVVRQANAEYRGGANYTFEDLSSDWEHACYLIGLPYSDAAVLKAFHEELAAE